MHAIDTERSPGLPSLMVTTRRRLMPHGTSFSFLHAVTQALHSMQRSESQRNFMRAMTGSPLGLERFDLAQRAFGLLHVRDRVVAVSGELVDRFAEHHGIGPVALAVRHGSARILAAEILALPPAGEVERHPRDALP